MDSKTERFHKFLDICCVQDVQDRAQYWSLGNSRSQLHMPWDRTTVMNRLCTTDDEGLHPVERRTRYSVWNGQLVQLDRMVHRVKRGTNVEQGKKRNLPLSVAEKISDSTRSSADSVEWCLLNLDWNLGRRLFAVKYSGCCQHIRGFEFHVPGRFRWRLSCRERIVGVRGPNHTTR